MASLLLQIGLTNVVLALTAAFAVRLVTLRWRNPQLAAVLWLVVLIKFVTPPLVAVHVDVPAEPKPAQPQIVSVDDAAVPTIPAEIAQSHAIDDPHMARTVATSDRSTRRVLHASPPKATPIATQSERATESSESVRAAFKDWLSGQPIVQGLAWLWLAGALVAAATLAVRAFQFNGVIAGQTVTHPAADLHAAFEQLCRRMRIRRAPRLRIVDAELSPLIWAWFGRTVVLLPKRMIDRFTLEQQTLVVAHELAHIRRRDLQQRWLEAVVQCVYWWLPPVRWIRNSLHAAQEQCCDASVLREFPARQAEYCDALLAAADWLASVRQPPLLASEFGRGNSLKHRIEAILERRANGPLTKWSQGMCAFIGAALLALSIRFVAAQEPQNSPAKSPTSFTTELIVTDPSGRPVASGQARISGALRYSKGFKRTAAIHDGKGSFTLESGRVLSMTVELESPGQMTFRQEFRSPDKEPSLVVAPRYKFRLTPGIAIGGQVVDQTGKPVASARVSAECPPDKPVESGANIFDRSTTTNADGRWQLSGAPADLSKLELRVRHAADVDEDLVVTVLDQLANLKALKDVRKLPSTPTLSGTVIDPQGKPVVGAMVLMEGRNSYRDYSQHNIPMTDMSGAFAISGVPSGMQIITIFSLDWALKTIAVSIPLKAPLRIELQKGKRVEFRTVDPEGNPVAKIGFFPQGPRRQKFAGDPHTNYLYVLDFLGHRDLLHNRSDEKGIFVWENAPNEALGYQIYQAGVLSQPGGDYGPDGSPHTIVFRRRIPVHGKIVDAATGAPIQGFALYEGAHFKGNPSAIGLGISNRGHSPNHRALSTRSKPWIDSSAIESRQKATGRSFPSRWTQRNSLTNRSPSNSGSKKTTATRQSSACQTASPRPAQRSTRRPRIPATFLAC
jgi:beta-lactamase regulating signal transducer with metallopeptidase domain